MQFIILCAKETYLCLETATTPTLRPPNVCTMLILYHSTLLQNTVQVEKAEN